MGRDKSKDTGDEKKVAKALKGKAVEVQPKEALDKILDKAHEAEEDES